ncbi:MAG: SDR family NAD(P)-dependent oxidoreductase [Gammaproteobacteria bacterium]|nr:SDR family NAD(P)-dependent oxidoreductase [Gammaproteobacteria bacterium]
MNLRDAKAIVTGGGSGLGLAVARRLVEAGARVAILDIQPAPAEPLAEPSSDGLLFLETDVTSEAAVDRAFAIASERLGGISLAVNCAGIVQAQRVLGAERLLSQAGFARVIAVNLIGTFTVCRAAANLMQHNAPNAEGERGVIINTTSIAAYEGQIGQAAYAASQGGVASLTLPLAREFAALGIRVMAIAPGLFDTPMLAGLPEKARAGLVEHVPYPKRLGSPREFAALVCHIYENPMLNGEVIRLDGALRMPPK